MLVIRNGGSVRISMGSTRLLGGSGPATRLLLVSSVGRMLGSYRAVRLRGRVSVCAGPSLPIGTALVSSLGAFVEGCGGG